MSERLTKNNGSYSNGRSKQYSYKQYNEESFYSDFSAAIDKLGKIEDIFYDTDGNEIISLDRLRELAEAERENRLTVYKYPNCYECPRLPKTNIWQDDEPCKSCRARALAATEPKGDAT